MVHICTITSESLPASEAYQILVTSHVLASGREHVTLLSTRPFQNVLSSTESPPRITCLCWMAGDIFVGTIDCLVDWAEKLWGHTTMNWAFSAMSHTALHSVQPAGSSDIFSGGFHTEHDSD